jgi:hypothetical protein
MDLGVDFLAAKIVGEVDAVEADPVKGAGVELHWLTPLQRPVGRHTLRPKIWSGGRYATGLVSRLPA